MTRLYTKLGDDGSTGLLFGGRVSKSDLVIDAVGALDEAVSALGVARAELAEPDTAEMVLTVQRHLFVVAADLAANPRLRDRLEPGLSQVTPDMIAWVEQSIDRLVAERPLRSVFVVPGSTRASAALDLARTVVRRAERRVCELSEKRRQVNPHVAAYVNRVSDLLYVLARRVAGVDEAPSHLSSA